MGLFDLFRKPKTEQEQYYEAYDRRTEQNNAFQPTYNNTPVYDTSFSAGSYAPQGFSITVEDVFAITGRGTVITGKIAQGSVSVGDTVTLQRANGQTKQVVIAGIEQFRKMLNTANAGDKVGILIRGITKADIGIGDVLMK